MGVGLVRNELDSWWLKYLSVVQDGEGVCLVNISFQAMECAPSTIPSKLRLWRLDVHRYQQPIGTVLLWNIRNSLPSCLSGGRARGRVRALAKHCSRFVWSELFHSV